MEAEFLCQWEQKFGSILTHWDLSISRLKKEKKNQNRNLKLRVLDNSVLVFWGVAGKIIS